MEALPHHPRPALSANKTSAGTVQYEGQTQIGKGSETTHPVPWKTHSRKVGSWRAQGSEVEDKNIMSNTILGENGRWTEPWLVIGVE